MIRQHLSYKTIALLIFIFPFLIASADAGQVVTKEERSQARTLLQREKGLKPPASQNTVAVLYFRNQTGRSEWDPLQKGIALMLITDLSKIEHLQVVERAQLQALMEELGMGTSGLVEPDTAPRVGKLLQARWLVGGDILKTKLETLGIQSDITDVSTQNILGRPHAEGNPEDLIVIEKAILTELIQWMKIEPTAGEWKKLRTPCSSNLQALMALFKGVEESDRGNYALAAEYYDKALKADADVCIASEALKELHIKGLIPGRKKSAEFLRSLKDKTSFTNEISPKEAAKRERSPVDVRKE
jgi:TolB-like protein